jgi:hypothetical protein
MIRRFAVVLVLFALTWGGISIAPAASLPLSDGTTLSGEPISFNAQGVVVKTSDGNFAPRVGWTNFTQEALKELAKEPKAKAFVEPYLELDEAETEKKPSLVIKPKPHDRMARPDPKAGTGAMFSSGISVLLFLLLYAGNIYAGFEIAIFRNYHPGLVCGIAAVAPILGPVLFLCLPTRLQKSHDELAAESMAEHASEEVQLAYTHPGGHGTAEGEAAAAEAAAAQPKVTVYQRGQTTFNRRFFETKFSGFLRVVPGDAEKDKEIYIKSSRGEHVGNRLTRIQPNELFLQVQKGDATADVIIPFNEIFEIQVRPKEA